MLMLEEQRIAQICIINNEPQRGAAGIWRDGCFVWRMQFGTGILYIATIECATT
jgi:hypothetical protein